MGLLVCRQCVSCVCLPVSHSLFGVDTSTVKFRNECVGYIGWTANSIINQGLDENRLDIISFLFLLG